MLRAAIRAFGCCCMDASNEEGGEVVKMQVEELPMTSASGLALSSFVKGSAWEAEAAAGELPLQIGTRAMPGLSIGRGFRQVDDGGSSSSDDEQDVDEEPDQDWESPGVASNDAIFSGTGEVVQTSL
mmetsp:Transcript_118621/g.295826  ORF Transcript_118621/g.295826 Transcript_118621/m.295826 type:complete len:127 (+) Transcript_118621:184-564(+)